MHGQPRQVFGGIAVVLVIMIFGVLLLAPTAQAAQQSAIENRVLQDGPQATMEPFLQTDLQILSGNVQRPNGIFWHDGYLYTACAGDFTLYRIDDTTGETITYVAGVQNTHTLFVEDTDSGPLVWAADFQRSALVSVTANTPRRADLLLEGLASPWGLAVADDGSFFVSQLRGDDVVHVTRDGAVDIVATGLRNPTGLVVDEDRIYVANNGSARRAIEWFEIPADGTELVEEDLKPLVSGLQNTTNVLIGPDNLLYFAYSLGTRGIVGRVNPTVCIAKDGCTNVDVEIVLWSEIAAPLAGLSISEDMRLFVHTMFGSEIYWVQLPA